MIVVDVQRDFCEGGSLAVEGGAATATAISELLTGDHDYDYVVATRDHHIDPGAHFSDRPDFVDTWPPHCVVETGGVEFHDQLTFRSFDAIFDKGEHAAAYSGFEGRSAEGTTMNAWLREHDVAAVDVCGIATDYCVRATAADAAEQGFHTRVLLDLTVAVGPANVPRVLAALSEVGVVVV